MQIRANNIWLEYDTFGDREAKPLLLISGLNTPMTRWTGDFCAQLASRGYFVIRYDNRDCGLSEHFDAYQLCSGTRLLLSGLLGMKTSVPYTLIDMVQDGFALLDALGIQQAHVVGRSMGGMIALLMAAYYPDRVSRLSVIMTSTGNRIRSLPSIDVMRHLFARKPNPQKNLAGYLRYRIAYSKAIGSKKYPLEDFYIRSRVMGDLIRSGFHPGAARRQLAAMLATGDITTVIRRISIPAVVIHGDADPLVPLRCGLDVYSNMKNAYLTVIKDMGHSLQPEFYDQIIFAMIEQGAISVNIH